MSTIAQTQVMLASRKVSPVELVEPALSAIEASQRQINAVTYVLAEAAIARARALEESGPSGPLYGLPVAVKDAFDVAGAPTTACCKAYGSRVATEHSAAVVALEAAGAIVVAKTNQHELMAGATNSISSFGPVRSPWDLERISGGSSGGSAAIVAIGAVPFALGSDTGGSIRMPASFCGVTGLKPTHGAVCLRGVLPMCPGLDTAGPLAASAEDCAAVFQIIRRPQQRVTPSATGAPSGPPVALTGVRIGLPRAFFQLVHPEVRAAIEEATRVLEALGARCEWVNGPLLDEGWDGFRHVWADVAHEYRDLWDREGVHPDVASLINLGRSLTGIEYASSLERAQEIRESFTRALGTVDVLLAPATPYPAPRAESTEVEVEDGVLGVHDGSPSRLTVPVNLAGLPALAFPVGFSADGLPLGAQLIGPPWWDDVLLNIGIAYQAATGWHTRKPPGPRQP